MSKIETLIKKLPKTDLHVHLDGSLRYSTLIDIAKKKKITLPSYTEDGLRKLVFKENYSSVGEYLKGFAFTVAVMQDAESLERIAYELAYDNFEEGVRYIEPRFAPQLHVNPNLGIEDVLRAANKGLLRAKKEINSRKEIKNGYEPPFEYGIIACALRMFNEHFSSYYKTLLEAHKFAPFEEVAAAASLELARAIVKIRDETDIPIVGIDLAGEEEGFPAEVHYEAYRYAHKNFMHKTVHAGEAFGPPSIFQAITDTYADRIGHGVNVFRHDLVNLPTEKERKSYTDALAQFIAERRITIEVCLTSNLQTNPEISSIKEHPFRQMNEARLSTTFCTDNRLVSSTTVTNEIMKAVETFNITPTELKNIIIYGFKRSFFPGSYLEKRKYVRQIINYYDVIASREAAWQSPASK